jgi:monoamine oxidase
MSRSLFFKNLSRAIRIAHFCEDNKISTREGLERVAELEHRTTKRKASRREFLANMGKLAMVGTIGSVAGSLPTLAAKPTGPDVSIGIVGAGLAGLACGYELKKNGITASLYDANNRVGGRCFSLRNFFPDQVAERGGEFIDNLHKTMLSYAKEFKLPLEDVEKNPPGEVFYFFNGQRVPESVVVDEYRDFVPAMHDDLRTLTPPTADNFTEDDEILDFTNLQEYLETRGAGPVIFEAIKQAYIAEYGLRPELQSCLNFLLFIHADRRSKFRPFGVYSDERYHVIGGNDLIVEGLRNRLQGQIELGMPWLKQKRTPWARSSLPSRMVLRQLV